MHSNPTGHQINRPLIISAGFPCQDASKANPGGKGLDGERTGLFYEALRIAHELEAEYIILENVANLLVCGWGTILREITKIGYCIWYRTISAETIGYPFQGKRIYAVAFGPALGIGLEKVWLFDEYFEKNLSKKAKQNDQLCRKISSALQPQNYAGFLTALDGIPEKLVPIRLHRTGNSVIPDFSEVIFKTIKTFHQTTIEPCY